MKPLLQIYLLTFGFCVQAQTNFYANITNLWYQGYKTNVLAIANARLAQNSNDIAGLILKMEYHLAFSEMSEMSNSFWRVVNVGETITTPNFAAEFPSKKEHLINILDSINENPLSPAELIEEQSKGNIIHKPLPAVLIEALQKDGYFD